MDNEVYLQVSGKACIDGKLNTDNEISVSFKRLGIYKVEKDTTTGDITYKAKNLDEVMIIDGEKLVIGKPKKGSQAQKFRFLCRDVWSQQFAGVMTEDEYYNQRMNEIIKEESEKLI